MARGHLITLILVTELERVPFFYVIMIEFVI